MKKKRSHASYVRAGKKGAKTRELKRATVRAKHLKYKYSDARAQYWHLK